MIDALAEALVDVWEKARNAADEALSRGRVTAKSAGTTPE